MHEEMTERLEEAFEYSAIWHLEKTECGDALTDEEDRERRRRSMRSGIP